MHSVEFVGGSLDGSELGVKECRSTLRLPPAPGAQWSEVYERREDGRYHFARHGVPPLVQLPEKEEAAANRELQGLVELLMPMLEKLDAHFAARGGYTQLKVGAWELTRRDDVAAGVAAARA
ncbi:MAG: hypothetical protein ACTHN5_06920 [Phycisphaerae bacterium]